MRKLLLSASALVGAALLANSAEAAKATYIPVVPPAGAVSTTVFSINDSNIIAGSYNDSAGVEHGFFGPLDGSNYTVIDLGGDVTGTEPRGIGNDGSITGLGKASGFTFGEEFFRGPAGNIVLIGTNTKIFDGVAQGFQAKGLNFVGDFIDAQGRRSGYKGRNGNWHTRIRLPVDTTSTNPRQKNDHGVVTGSYTDSAGVQHGFLLKNGSMTTFDYPGSVGVTVGEGINNKGQVSGLWTDSSGNRHGFVLDTNTTEYTLIDGGDGSFFQQVWGINSAGLIAVNTTADGTNYVSYIYCPHKAENCPSGGPGAREVEVHPIKVAALQVGKHGTAGRHLSVRASKVRANIP
jgi:hypothetical protein